MIFQHESVIVLDSVPRLGGLIVMEIIGELRFIRILKHRPIPGKVKTIAVGIRYHRAEVESPRRKHFIYRWIRLVTATKQEKEQEQ